MKKHKTANDKRNLHHRKAANSIKCRQTGQNVRKMSGKCPEKLQPYYDQEKITK